MKDFAYVSLENDSEVSIWMSSLYMTNILRVYGQIYMSDGDKFKETFEGVQSLKRRAIPYGPNEPLTSTSSKLNKSYDVYGLFFMIPKKSTSAFVKLFKEIMISKQMKKTIEAYKANQKANKIQTNQLFDALTSFDSNTWKSITTSCQKTFENAYKRHPCTVDTFTSASECCLLPLSSRVSTKLHTKRGITIHVKTCYF